MMFRTACWLPRWPNRMRRRSPAPGTLSVGGARTPTASLWPHRGDMYHRGRRTSRAVPVQSASVLHTNGEGIAVHDGGIVGVRGRVNDQINLGRVDPKDLRTKRSLGVATPPAARYAARRKSASQPGSNLTPGAVCRIGSNAMSRPGGRISLRDSRANERNQRFPPPARCRNQFRRT